MIIVDSLHFSIVQADQGEDEIGDETQLLSLKNLKTFILHILKVCDCTLTGIIISKDLRRSTVQEIE